MEDLQLCTKHFAYCLHSELELFVKRKSVIVQAHLEEGVSLIQALTP